MDRANANFFVFSSLSLYARKNEDHLSAQGIKNKGVQSLGWRKEAGPGSIWMKGNKNIGNGTGDAGVFQLWIMKRVERKKAVKSLKNSKIHQFGGPSGKGHSFRLEKGNSSILPQFLFPVPKQRNYDFVVSVGFLSS